MKKNRLDQAPLINDLLFMKAIIDQGGYIINNRLYDHKGLQRMTDIKRKLKPRS